MKRTKKIRLTAFVTALLFLFSLFPATVFATEYSTDGATTAVFSESGVSVSGEGVSSDGSNLTVTKSGTYILSGSGSGSVTVEKGITGVTLVLSGLTLKSEDGAAIICKKGTEVTVIAADGTENFLSDTEKNNDENYPDNENAENAVIKCKDGSKVVLCGGGTLTVTANGKNGIKSGLSGDDGDASLTIKELALNVVSTVNDGINAEQELNILSGNITVSAEDKGIHCDYVMNIGAENTEGPTVTVSESYEGLEAATVNVYSGNLTLYSSDDCINAANKELSDYSFAINISGGKIWAYSSGGDGFDSNGTIDISGGDVTVWTANTADDQPLDADGKITVSGGKVFAAGGSSGMGMNLTSSEGYVIFGNSGGMGQGGGMRPSDGGNMQTPPDMNGNSADGMQTPPDMNSNNSSAENAAGSATSDEGFTETAKSDNGGTQESGTQGNAAASGNTQGNGTQGGKTRPSGDSMTPPDGANGNMTPPDGSADGNKNGSADGEIPTFPGGGQNANVSKGSTLSVADSSGNTLFSEETPCNVNFVFFASSDIAENGEYSLLADGEETLTATGSTGETSSSFAPDGNRDFNGKPGGGFNVLYIIIPVAAFLVGGGVSALVILLCVKKGKKKEKKAAGAKEEKENLSANAAEEKQTEDKTSEE